jgi:hypothetical protein
MERRKIAVATNDRPALRVGIGRWVC